MNEQLKWDIEKLKSGALQIIKNYGVMAQQKYISTEQWELTEAIVRYEGCLQDNLIQEREVYDLEVIKHQIAGELADNFLMLLEFKEYYKIDDDEILNIMFNKADRQLKRIEEENDRIGTSENS